MLLRLLSYRLLVVAGRQPVPGKGHPIHDLAIRTQSEREKNVVAPRLLFICKKVILDCAYLLDLLLPGVVPVARGAAGVEVARALRKHRL
jgi:hypothetical protein